ncbi:MAG: DUF411 domain-containing protein [Alphaproteobacteria bacterium]|nr:DUF411 domain-containing protein [Alphaproteobacteria bacterium]
MRKLLYAAAISVMGAVPAFAETLPQVDVYKSPLCGCCSEWVEHMRAAGFPVNVRDVEDMTPLKKMAGVPEEMESCHTAVVDGYLVEGHVPASDVKRLLTERPEARGLSAPGMPVGSPGMEQGGHKDPYDVILFGGKTGDRVYSRQNTP